MNGGLARRSSTCPAKFQRSRKSEAGSPAPRGGHFIGKRNRNGLGVAFVSGLNRESKMIGKKSRKSIPLSEGELFQLE